MIPKIELTREIAKQNIHDSNKGTQFYYNRNSAYPKYNIGQKVLLFDPVTKKGICKKLKKRWIGPYFITAEGDGYTYKLRQCDGGQELRAFVHSNRLRPFHDSRDLYHTRNPPSAGTDANTTQAPSNSNNANTPTTGLGDGWYEIDRVTNRCMIAGKPHFRVHWKDETKTYEPDENVSDYAKAEYYARCQAKRKPKRRLQQT